MHDCSASDVVVTISQKDKYTAGAGSVWADCKTLNSIPFVFILITFIMFLIYAPVVFAPYAFMDSYTILYAALRHQMSGELHAQISGGRPISALIYTWAFSQMRGVPDLRWLRGASVLGIAALATAVYHQSKRQHLPLSLVLALPLLIGLMPPFEVYASWASTFLCPWTALLACAAFMMIGRKNIGHPAWRDALASFVLLTAALATYQPAAMMFWLFASIAWLTAPEFPARHHVFRAGTVMGAALLAEYALSKILPLIVFSNSHDYTRTMLVDDVPHKVGWFFTQPLFDSLNLALIVPRIWIATAVAAFIVGGLWLYRPGTCLVRLLRIGLAITLLPLAYLPNLLVNEDWSSYRTQVALTSLVLFYSALALVGWLRRVRWQRLVPVCAALAVITCAGFAARNVLLEFVLPQTLEYRAISSAFRESKLKGAKHFYFVCARWYDTLAPVVRYDEFGLPSSAAPWVPKAMAWLILRARHSPYAELVASASSVGNGVAPPGSTIVDFGKALRE